MRLRLLCLLLAAGLLAAVPLPGKPSGQAPAPAAAQEEEPPVRPANLILVNARVLTLDPDQPEAQAVAIRGQRIIKVGTNEEVRRLARSDYTRILDLRGRLGAPGCLDHHTPLPPG